MTGQNGKGSLQTPARSRQHQQQQLEARATLRQGHPCHALPIDLLAKGLTRWGQRTATLCAVFAARACLPGNGDWGSYEHLTARNATDAAERWAFGPSGANRDAWEKACYPGELRHFWVPHGDPDLLDPAGSIESAAHKTSADAVRRAIREGLEEVFLWK